MFSVRKIKGHKDMLKTPNDTISFSRWVFKIFLGTFRLNEPSICRNVVDPSGGNKCRLNPAPPLRQMKSQTSGKTFQDRRL